MFLIELNKEHYENSLSPFTRKSSFKKYSFKQ